MAGQARWRAARGAGAWLIALATIAVGAVLCPRRGEVDLDATVEHVAARLHEVNALLEPRVLAQRVARLRGMVEEELGRPIPGAVEVVPIGRKAWAERLATRAAGMPWSGEAEQMRGWLAAFSAAFLRAQWTVASYDADRDCVDLLGHHFAEEADPVTRSALLDLVLAHELVHVWHHRVHPGAPLLTEREEPERAAAAGAAGEGHAQVIAHRVAKRLGLESQFDLIRIGLEDARLDGLPPADRSQTLALLAPLAFRYRTGERYVSELVDRLGIREATRKILYEPPRTVAEVCGIRETDTPPADGPRSLDACARRIAAALGSGKPRLEPTLPDEIWLRLRALPDSEAVAATAHVRGAARFAPEVTGPWHDHGLRIDIELLDDAQAAAHFARTLEHAAREETLFVLPPTSVEVRKVELAGTPRSRVIVWSVEADNGLEGFILHGIAPRGSIVVEVTAASEVRDVAPFARLLERLSAMVPDDKEDERAARLRAVADETKPASLLAGLRDADPDVALIALGGLMRSGVLDEVPPGLRDELRSRADEDLGIAILDAWPDDAEVLQALLRSGSPFVRAAALARVADPGSRRSGVSDALLIALDDAEPHVRVAALRALCKADARVVDSGPVLARLHDVDPGVRAAALFAVREQALLGTDALQKAALEATADPAPRVRVAAWQAFLRAAGDSGQKDARRVAFERAADAFEDPSPAVRLGAARALAWPLLMELPDVHGGAYRGSALAGVLARALQDPDPRVRGTVAASLSWFSVFVAPHGLVRLVYRAREDAAVRMFAPAAVAAHVGRDNRATDIVTAALIDPWTYAEAASALAPDGFDTADIDRERADPTTFGSRCPPRLEALRPVFAELAVHWDPGVRLHGLAGCNDLGEHLPPELLRAALTAALERGSSDDRSEAASMAATLGREAVPLVPILLDRAREEQFPLGLGPMLRSLRKLSATCSAPTPGELVACAEQPLRSANARLRSSAIEWASDWLEFGTDEPRIPDEVMDQLAEAVLPALDDADSGVRHDATRFAYLVPERWRGEADRILAERIRVEEDPWPFEALAQWYMWRQQTELPACLREAFEARREDENPEIAAHAESALWQAD